MKSESAFTLFEALLAWSIAALFISMILMMQQRLLVRLRQSYYIDLGVIQLQNIAEMFQVTDFSKRSRVYQQWHEQNQKLFPDEKDKQQRAHDKDCFLLQWSNGNELKHCAGL